MITLKIREIHSEIVGGNSCSCVKMSGSVYSLSSNDSVTCKLLCCVPTVPYVGAYIWNGKVTPCFESVEDHEASIKLFLHLLPTLYPDLS